MPLVQGDAAAAPSAEAPSEAASEVVSAALAVAPLAEAVPADRGRTIMYDIKKEWRATLFFFLLLRFPFKNLHYLAHKGMPYNILLVEIYHTYPFKPLEHGNTFCKARI